MGQRALINPVRLGDSGPPPNSNFVANGHKYVGRGSPEGRVSGFVGDEYLDLDSGDAWNKMSPLEEPRQATTTGWELEVVSDTSDVLSTNTTTSRSTEDRWAEARNVRDFGATSDGTDARAAIVAALAVWDVVRFTTGSYSVASDITIAAGKVLVFEPGAKLKPANGVKITINGEVQAGRHEIFDYSASGKVVFTSVGIGVNPGTNLVYPEWYGAKANNTTTNNDNAFQRYYDQTLTITENQHLLDCCMGYYDFSTGFTGRSGMKIRGHPSGKTRLQFSPTAASGTARFITIPAAVDGIYLENIQINARAVTAGVRTIAIGHTSASHEVTEVNLWNVWFTGWNQYALDFGKAQHVNILGSTRFQVSNVVANGGTASGSAYCIRFQTYGNGVYVGGGVRVANSEGFLQTTLSASMTVTGCRFEQGASSPVDAISGKGSFIDVQSGGAIEINGNYFEGIATATANAMFSMNNCKGYLIQGNTISLHRPSGSTAMSDVVVSQTGTSFGGEVSGNDIIGLPANYYIYNDGNGGTIFAPANTFRNNSLDVLTSFSQVSSKLSNDVSLSTPTEWKFSRAQLTRIGSTQTNVTTIQTWEKLRTNGAGSTNDGVQVAAKMTNDNGSQQNVGSMGWIFTDASNSTEKTNWFAKVQNTGAVVDGIVAHGQGGVATQGGIMPQRLDTAVSAAVAQKYGTVIITASGTTQTLPNSSILPENWPCTLILKVGGAATATIEFTNGTDRIQPSNAATYSLSADGKFVHLRYIGSNTWIIEGSN